MSLLTDMNLPEEGGEQAWKTAAVNIERHVKSQEEMQRVDAAKMRKKLYKDSGVEYVQALIDRMFKDPVNKTQLKAIAANARFDNPTKRLVDEKSTVYMRAPVRALGNTADEQVYLSLVRKAEQNDMMRRANAYLNLFNDILIWFRVRQRNGEFVPVIDVLSPDQFYVIPHAIDPTLPIAYIRDLRTGTAASKMLPRYSVWTDTEKFLLNGDFEMLGPPTANVFERIPGIFAHREPQDGQMFDSTSGQDIIDADLSAWFINTLLVKETKSMNRQAALLGDTSTAATGQTQDTEHDMVLPEGVSLQTIERGGNLGEYRDTADHVVERAAGNHGLPPTVLRHAGATSGDEVRLRERRLREMRGDQINKFRDYERELAEIESLVWGRATGEDFSVEQWSIDYAEVEAPMSPQEDHDLFLKRRQSSLTSTVEQMRKLNPDLKTDAEALAQIVVNTINETKRIQALRELQRLNASMDTGFSDATAEENGALGQEQSAPPQQFRQ